MPVLFRIVRSNLVVIVASATAATATTAAVAIGTRYQVVVLPFFFLFSLFPCTVSLLCRILNFMYF